MSAKRATVAAGPSEPTLDDHGVERAGEIIDLAKPAALDQRRLGRRAVDERGSGNEIAVGVEGVRESGGEVGRVVAGEVGDAADQRDDVEAAQRTLAQILERTVERASPAKADLHIVAQQRRT